MNIVYGPIASWRLGRSLGVDLLCSEQRICTFNCTYCQLKKGKVTTKKNIYIQTPEVQKSVQKALQQTTADVITFSGMGEPTLATNMDEVITTIRDLTSLPIAILTNSSLLFDKAIQKNLRKIDIIVAKLDASNQELFTKISRPAKNITFEKTLMGIKEMRKDFPGKFALQIMFLEQNKNYASQLAEIARDIQPDEVQINTPLRPSPVLPLTMNELDSIEKEFNGLHTISVYHSPKPTTVPLDMEELIRRRRPEP